MKEKQTDWAMPQYTYRHSVALVHWTKLHIKWKSNKFSPKKNLYKTLITSSICLFNSPANTIPVYKKNQIGAGSKSVWNTSSRKKSSTCFSTPLKKRDMRILLDKISVLGQRYSTCAKIKCQLTSQFCRIGYERGFSIFQ